MYRSSFRWMIVVLAIGALLLSPWAATAESHFTIQPGQLRRGADLPLDLVTRLCNLVDRILTKTGAWIDPNGGILTKTGASIDPNGGNGGSTPGQGSAPTAQEDTGCSPDPNGGCGR